jgi:hypothetical protein
MSALAVAAIGATLLASHTAPQFDVTAGPAKVVVQPGAVITQKVANHGTMPETISIGPDEIGKTATGACGFIHAAPLAAASISSVHLNPGEAQYVTVTVAKSGPAGTHKLTMDYTLAGTGNVRVSEGVATVIQVTYPGSNAPAPCAISATPPSFHVSMPAKVAGLAAVTAGLAYIVVRRRAAS